MLSPGNLTVLLVVLGPIAWRKYSSWQGHQARDAMTNGDIKKRAFFSIPDQLWLPSNLLLSISFFALLYVHLSKLFDPAKVLSRSDLFLLTNTAVTSSVAQLRSKVASMTFKELGWRRHWGEEGLETILRRLSSFEGRKLHLMIGTSPFLQCSYCTTTNDYLILSISDHLSQYALDLMLFGILTLRFDSLEILDEIVFSNIDMITGRDVRPKPSGHSNRQSSLRPDGNSYRTPALYLIGAFILAQAAVYFGLQDVPFGSGRWDHRIPRIPAMIEIANLIKQSRYLSDMTLTHVQALHLSNQILWTDAGLREKVIEWHARRGDETEKALSDGVINSLNDQAAKIGVDTSQMRKDSRLMAQEIWSNAEDSASVWEQAMQSAAPLIVPNTPSTASSR